MNYLFNTKKEIKAIGFDMDGTLYDEYDFISQVYSEIANLLNDNAYEFMSKRWLEKGSSYNKIFDEAYDLFGSKNNLSKSIFINEALNIFRNFSPTLTLNKRCRTILAQCKEDYKLFLISDGNYNLQKKKFKALKLDNFFQNKNIVFTGKYGPAYEKPNIRSLELLNIDPLTSLFVGDRQIDKEFALNSGMQFKKVYNMIEVNL